MFTPTPLKRIIFFVLSDLLIFLFTLQFSYNLRFNFTVPENFMDSFYFVFFSLVILKVSTFFYFRLYRTAWRFFSLYEIKKIILAHIISYLIFTIVFLIFKEFINPFPRSVIIIDFCLSLVFITLLRLSKRIILESGRSINHKNTLIIGASNSIKNILNEKKSLDYTPVAIIDETKDLRNTYLSNLKVYPFEELEKVVKTKSIEVVIFTKVYEQKFLLDITNRLNDLNVHDIKVLNKLSSSSKTKELKDVTVEDLLARHPQDLDKKKIKNFIKDKVVLITGAGGSIGSEISRQCQKLGAKQLILVDHSEYNLYKISEELKDTNIVSVMQTVRNFGFIENSFKKYKPQIVIHAAAYKHVPLVEENILEGISNNIIGTKNCIDLAIKYEVEKFVLISTDKAVRPTNVMGTTKRICELYAQNVKSNKTEIVAVRFGNVLGSSGSVIPKFKKQIAQGGPLTVTHPEITRYFMLINEACELVLQAASLGKGGEIFILDMGEPVKIVDLAKKMIKLSGKSDIKIEFCGLRTGEKLYEELLINDTDKNTDYESITVATSTNYDIEKLNKDIEELLVCENKIEKLKEIVPEFNHQIN